jgi:hypothetical protein
MTCDDARLDEYLDGELAGADRASTEAHVASCPPCRAELDKAGKLEALLRRVPAGAPPDAERFLARIKARSRRPAPWRFAAAAAVILGGVAAFYAVSRPSTPSVEEDVAAYLRAPAAEIEKRLKAAGPDALRLVEARLESSDVKAQFAAASLLFRLLDPRKDAAILARVTARFQPPAREWVLADLGAEESDVETVPIALSALETGEAWSMDALRHLNRMHADAQRKVVGAVVTLLKSDKPEIQKRALEIVKELDIEFPLTAVVDLLDSPDLGEEARRILRRATGKDFGRDKRAWSNALKETP